MDCNTKTTHKLSATAEKAGWLVFLVTGALGHTSLGLVWLLVAAIMRGVSGRGWGLKSRQSGDRLVGRLGVFEYSAFAFLVAMLVSAAFAANRGVALAVALGFVLLFYLVVDGSASLVGPTPLIDLRRVVPWVIGVASLGFAYGIYTYVGLGRYRAVGPLVGENGLGTLSAFVMMLIVGYVFQLRGAGVSGGRVDRTRRPDSKGGSAAGTGGHGPRTSPIIDAAAMGASPSGVISSDVSSSDRRSIALRSPGANRYVVKWAGLVAALLLSAVALALSFSRGAWFSLVPSAAVFGLLMILSGKFDRKKVWVVFVCALVLVALAFSIGPIREQVLDQFVGLFGVERNEDRLFIWSAGLNMLLSNPIVGVGGGNFPFEYGDYKLPGDPNESFTFAHNMFLQIGAEYGLLGLIPFTILIVVALWRGWFVARRGDPLVISLYAAYVGMFAHEMVDNITYSIDMGGIFWLVTGIWLHLYGREGGRLVVSGGGIRSGGVN